MGKTEKEQSEKLRRFLDREPGAEPPEDQELLRMAQLLEAGAPEAEEVSSRRRVWTKVSREVTPAPEKARRWPWWPASTLALSGAAVAVADAHAAGVCRGGQLTGRPGGRPDNPLEIGCVRRPLPPVTIAARFQLALRACLDDGALQQRERRSWRRSTKNAARAARSATRCAPSTPSCITRTGR